MHVGESSRGAPAPADPEQSIDRFYADVGRRVRGARVAAGFTQDELAKALLLARSSIANLEAGRQRVPAHTLLLAARALQVALSDLLPELDVDIAPVDGLGLLPNTPEEHVQLLQRVMSSVPERSA